MNLLKSSEFHFALYSLIIFIAVVRHGNAPIESAGSKLTIVLMALLIFGEAAKRMIVAYRNKTRPAGGNIDV